MLSTPHVLRFPLVVFSLVLAGCLNSGDGNESHNGTKDGPRSVTGKLYKDTELGFSLAVPQTWQSWVYENGGPDAILDAAFSPGLFSQLDLFVHVGQDYFDSTMTLQHYVASRNGSPEPVQIRQGVTIYVDSILDNYPPVMKTRRFYFVRGNRIVTIEFQDTQADFAANANLSFVDSSLTFF